MSMASYGSEIRKVPFRVNFYRDLMIHRQVGSYQVYESLFNIGKETQRCSVCDRHMDAKVFAVFETFVSSYHGGFDA